MSSKSDAFFVVSNFNHDPIPISTYAEDYVILDQSNDPEIVDYLHKLQNPNIKFSKHVGHNLIDYLDFIISNWENLPHTIAFTKGNMIGRHVEMEHWLSIYQNTHYTFIYSDRELRNIPNIQFAGWNSNYNEINNSWFVWNSHHRYFTNTNQMIEFLYENPKIPYYLTFSPGACYIVESSRIKNKPLPLWIGLREILSYEFFPSEAWMIERLLHTIFFSEDKFNEYVYETEEFLREIRNIPDRSLEKQPQKHKIELLRSKIYWKWKSLRG